MPAARVKVLLDDDVLPEDVLGQLSLLEVRESDMEPSVAALRFGLRQSSAGEFKPLDDRIFTPAKKLAIELAAPGGNLRRLFSGFVTHVRPHFETVEANCFLEILAMDGAVILDAYERVEVYSDTTDSGAFDTVLGRYDDFAGQSTATHTRHEVKVQALVQRETDWRFIMRLAERNGYRCYFEYDESQKQDVCYFGPAALTDPPQPDLAILFENENLKWVDIQHLMTGPVKRVGWGVDPIAKTLTEARGASSIGPLGDEGVSSAVEEGLVAAGAGGASALLRDPSALPGLVDVESTARTDSDCMMIQARGELDPALYRGLLRARRPVLVKGLGRDYSGVYWVNAVRTTLVGGMLSQTFVAERNATGITGREDFGQTAEEIPAE